MPESLREDIMWILPSCITQVWMWRSRVEHHRAEAALAMTYQSNQGAFGKTGADHHHVY